MEKLTKKFFDGGEVLFVGFSSKRQNKMFHQGLYQTLTKHGIKVYPMNNKPDASFNIKVYKDFKELPKVPKCAYILMNKEHTKKALNQLKEQGVKKVLFQNKNCVDQEILDKCKELGLETVCGCPMMLYGGGIHKIHALFAGVK